MLSRRTLVLTLLGAMLAASCSSETKTSLRVTVHLDEALGIDQLRLSPSPEGGDHLVPDGATS